MASLKKLAKKYPSFFDTTFVLAGIAVTRVIDFEPSLGVSAFILVIAAVVVAGRSLEYILSKSGRKGLAERVQPLIGKAVAQVLTLAADLSVGVGFGIILGLRTWWGVVFFAIYFAIAVAMISVKKALPDDESQRAPALTLVISEQDFVSKSKPLEDWFRKEDLHQLSKHGLFLMALYGGLVGFVAFGLILLYAALLYFPLLPWLVYGVLAGSVFLAGVGLFRNRILRYVAARGFRAAFRFRKAAFGFYLEAVASGALGIGYGYGYVSPQSTGLVLPLAGLFVLFLYLHILWSKIFLESEEGRLCVFQFLSEHSQNGGGYSWLKRGLSVTQNTLQSFGVSVKRHGLYFGSSYSLLEGSYLDWDLDSIYLLGDWTSQPNDLKAVHEIVSWFLYRSRRAEKRGFSRVFSPIDHLLEASPQSLYYIIAAVGVIAGILIAVLRR